MFVSAVRKLVDKFIAEGTVQEGMFENFQLWLNYVSDAVNIPVIAAVIADGRGFNVTSLGAESTIR